MADVDWTDPCARAAALSNAYYKLLSGQSAVEIETRTIDAHERVRFTPANLAALLSEMRIAESQCAVASGQPDPNRRFAIRAGTIFRDRGCP